MPVLEGGKFVPTTYSEWKQEVMQFFRQLEVILPTSKSKLQQAITVKEMLDLLDAFRARKAYVDAIAASPFLSRLETDLQNEIDATFSVTTKVTELQQFYTDMDTLVNRKFFDPNEPPPPNGISLRDKYFDANGNPILKNPDLTDKLVDPADFTDLVQLMTNYGI